MRNRPFGGEKKPLFSEKRLFYPIRNTLCGGGVAGYVAVIQGGLNSKKGGNHCPWHLSCKSLPEKGRLLPDNGRTNVRGQWQSLRAAILAIPLQRLNEFLLRPELCMLLALFNDWPSEPKSKTLLMLDINTCRKAATATCFQQ